MSEAPLRPPCEVRRLGRLPYAAAWELQKTLAGQRAADVIPDTLLLLEHPPTYTFGRQGQAANLLWDEAALHARGLEVVWVDRGGDVTFHGPGQLVGYPILKLGTPASQAGRLPQADYIGYVRRLEAMLIRVCAGFGLAAGQVAGLTGVWIQPDTASRCAACPPAARLAPSKIAAIGVKVDARGISQHGFALNVAPDMSYWDGIIGCGLKGHAAIALADLLEAAPALDRVMDEVVRHFGHVFNYAMIERAAAAP